MLETNGARPKYGRRNFEYIAPRLWNALTLEIRTIVSTPWLQGEAGDFLKFSEMGAGKFFVFRAGSRFHRGRG